MLWPDKKETPEGTCGSHDALIDQLIVKIRRAVGTWHRAEKQIREADKHLSVYFTHAPRGPNMGATTINFITWWMSSLTQSTMPSLVSEYSRVLYMGSIFAFPTREASRPHMCCTWLTRNSRRNRMLNNELDIYGCHLFISQFRNLHFCLPTIWQYGARFVVTVL